MHDRGMIQRFTHELHTVQRAGTNQECPSGVTLLSVTPKAS